MAASLGPFAQRCLAKRARKRAALRRVTSHPLRLALFDDDLRADKQVVMAAVGEDWSAFRFAAESLRADTGFVSEVAACDVLALQYAAEALRGNRDVVLGWMRSDVEAFRFASKELQADRALALKAVKREPYLAQFVSMALRNDASFMLDVACTDHIFGFEALRFAGESLLSDPAFFDAFRARHRFGVLEECYLFQITLLSGRSCYIFRYDKADDTTLGDVLRESARKLGLGDERYVERHGRLLVDGAPVPDGELRRCELLKLDGDLSLAGLMSFWLQVAAAGYPCSACRA